MTPTDLKVCRFNARIAATLRRLAQEAPAPKQDPTKTMMGAGWDPEEQQAAQKMITDFKATVAALDATAGPLAEYAAKVDPQSVKQVGHMVRFAATTKPIVDKLVKQTAALATLLKAYV